MCTSTSRSSTGPFGVSPVTSRVGAFGHELFGEVDLGPPVAPGQFDHGVLADGVVVVSAG